tara:strand:+ start:113 stop:406 length:294 start_codon:yes stop_codon:yes gene_type:complete
MYDVKRRIDDNINLMVPWYLMTSYLYYKCHESIISDEQYDWLCTEILSKWDDIKHPHKKYIDKDSLSAGTGYTLNEYPERVKGAAKAVLGNVNNVEW